jgi:hypothetical protein
MVGEDTTQVLTNKTISSTTNNVHARALINATGSVTVGGSAAPTAGQVLTASSGTVAAWTTIPLKPSFISGSQVVTKTSVEAASFVSVTNADTAGAILYAGSPTLDIANIRFRAACSDVGAVFAVRLFDLTNSLVIAQNLTIINSTTQTIYDMIGISNVPTAPAALQLQVQFTSGTGSVTFTSWSLQLSS